MLSVKVCNVVELLLTRDVVLPFPMAGVDVF